MTGKKLTFRNDDEQKIWFAAFEGNSRHMASPAAVEYADKALLEFRERQPRESQS